ncbi:MAG: hypothetical protein ACLPT4_11690 [Verrucomicrobiia bacterium]
MNTKSSGHSHSIPEAKRADAINALLHEYDGLVAENQLALGGTDTKLSIGMGTVAAFVGAGIWKSSPELFLVAPFILVVFSFFVVAQVWQSVFVGAQLAVVEKRINELIHPEILTFFSRTVPRICDEVRYRHPLTGRTHISFFPFYGTGLSQHSYWSAVFASGEAFRNFDSWGYGQWCYTWLR